MVIFSCQWAQKTPKMRPMDRFPSHWAHRENVLARIAEMEKHLEKVTWKLNFFTEKLRAYEAQQAEKK